MLQNAFYYNCGGVKYDSTLQDAENRSKEVFGEADSNSELTTAL